MNRSLLGRVAMTIFLIFPGTAAALEAGTGQDPIHPPESGQIQTTADRFVHPEERVAAMVREALRAPENNESWACLDLALKEMNAPAADGQTRNPQAIRVADSVACPSGSTYWTASSSNLPPTQPGGPEGESWSSDSQNGAWQRVYPFLKNYLALLTREPWIVSGFLLLASVALLWFGRNSVLDILDQSRGSRGRDESPAGSATTFAPSPENPVAMALALWEGGLPSPEIARRTGLAQDAVSVLLSLKGKTSPVPADGPDQVSSPNPYAHTRVERR